MTPTKKIISQGVQGYQGISVGSQGIATRGGPQGYPNYSFGNQGYQGIYPEKLLLKAKKVATSINRERKLDSLLDDVDYIPFKLEESKEFQDYINALGPQGYSGTQGCQGSHGPQKSVIQKISEKFRRKYFNSKVK
jgi:hypothetical protein